MLNGKGLRVTTWRSSMNIKALRAAIAALALAGLTAGASAGAIRSGTVIASSASACCGLVASLLVDQSGLSSNYVNGVTDFDTYLASSPTALGSSTWPLFPAGYFAFAGAVVDIDLGASYTLARLAMWNDHDYQGVDAFHLLISDTADFAVSSSLGAFNAMYGNNDNNLLSYDIGTPHQVFDLTDATGRYVRVVFDSAHQDTYINLNEIAFDTGSGENHVPEPASLALVGLGLAGLVARRRR
ncbi:PEP-CTERM sorting domain-containing protein [Pelomonas sp. SE-A7]|uniref:PEP-CTERM sorting domain-containing protein n=1 Tax=Pelomonas sp. SE-A7 TaxID=3054953 RepID=UPI00259C6C8D|nr:PEP-CTERM sorting domain-containing protein [Pelomonas sp. SE-A7]MDM4766620.1 PEP-CTERM sorting domain-containing protein [Pelomonas sp. SE-A7]